MTTLIIKTNTNQLTDVLIKDLGFNIPASGGSLTFNELEILDQIGLSVNLRELATDDAFGVNSSTLIINDGTSDISQLRVSSFLRQLVNAIPAHIELIDTFGNSTLYFTIGAATAIATSGSTILVGPGTYTESFTIPTSVTIRSAGGSSILSPPTSIIMGDSTILQGFTIVMPSSATPALSYNSSGTATIIQTTFIGTSPLSVGVVNSGTGTFIAFVSTFGEGVCDCLFYNKTGKGVASNFSISDGIVTTAICTSGTRFDFSNLSSFNSGVVTLIKAGGSGALVGLSSIFKNHSIGLNLTSDNVKVELSGIDNEATVADLLVDSNLTGSGTGTLRVIGSYVNSTRFSAPVGWLERADTTFVFSDDRSTQDPAFHLVTQLHVGSPLKQQVSAFGEGGSTTFGTVVLTTDSTATDTADGGSISDVSVAAASRTSSTFSFQGTASGYSILIGSQLETSIDKVKHWGLKIKQTIAAVEVVEKSFIFEYWNGSSWVEIDVMITHHNEYHRYGNSAFIRSDQQEHIRYGIAENTSWMKKTIAGINAFWSRIRIINDLTTAPVFERLQIHTNSSEICHDGTMSFFGTSRFEKTILETGNVFGEDSGVVDVTVAVGSGGDPTGWDHHIKNSSLGGAGDTLFAQFILPRGIDTSLPLRVTLYYSIDPGGSPSVDPILILSVLPLEIRGNLVADPTGGATPVERAAANTAALTDKAALTETITVTETTGNIIQKISSNFSIADYYEGDMVLVKLTFNNDGTPNQNIEIWGMEICGAFWIDGGRRRV